MSTERVVATQTALFDQNLTQTPFQELDKEQLELSISSSSFLQLLRTEFQALKAAAVAIVGCADVKSFLTGKWGVVDATIAMQNVVITAWALGIGSSWIGACNEKNQGIAENS